MLDKSDADARGMRPIAHVACPAIDARAADMQAVAIGN